MRNSIWFQWNPKGYPLGSHWLSIKLAHFPRGNPSNMWGNLLNFNEVLNKTRTFYAQISGNLRLRFADLQISAFITNSWRELQFSAILVTSWQWTLTFADRQISAWDLQISANLSLRFADLQISGLQISAFIANSWRELQRIAENCRICNSLQISGWDLHNLAGPGILQIYLWLCLKGVEINRFYESD